MKTLKQNNRSFAEIKGNIFESIKNQPNKVIVLPHVCNNANIFGGGFTYDLDQNYPIVKANFQVNGPQKLGYTQYINISKTLIIANMIAQNGILNDKNRRPLHYPSLIRCMYDVRNLGNKISDELEKPFEIHAPKFGSGLSGGNWNFISDIIDDIWGNIPTFIYLKK